MEKKETKKITLQDLLENAQKERKVEYFTSEELGGDIEIVKQSGFDVLKQLEKIEGSYTKGLRSNCIIILDHCPLFQNSELQKQYKVGEPWEVIPKIFNENIGEIAELADKISGMYHLNEEAENLKN